MRLILFLCLSLVFVVFADTNTTTQAQDDTMINLLITAITSLFGVMISGLIIFWNWITKRFDKMDDKLEKMEEKMERERDEQDKRFDGIVNHMLSKINYTLQQNTERTERKQS